MAERDFPRNYNSEASRVLEAMSLSKGKNLRVIGSAALRPILFAGDLDANEIISGSPASVAKGLQAAARRLKDMPGVVVGDIKCGGTLDRPKRWTLFELLEGEGLEEAVSEPGLRKMDAVALISGRYVEVNVVYMYEKETIGVRDYVEELQASAREKLAEGDYWKALKRWFSILRLKDSKQAEKLIPIFNGDLGILYSVISDIRVLMYLLQHRKGSKAAMSAEIDNFKSRLSHIWKTPEFIKKEPTFDKEIDAAANGNLDILDRLEKNFNTILQEKAKPLAKKYIGKLRGGGITFSSPIGGDDAEDWVGVEGEGNGEDVDREAIVPYNPDRQGVERFIEKGNMYRLANSMATLTQLRRFARLVNEGLIEADTQARDGLGIRAPGLEIHFRETLKDAGDAVGARETEIMDSYSDMSEQFVYPVMKKFEAAKTPAELRRLVAAARVAVNTQTAGLPIYDAVVLSDMIKKALEQEYDVALKRFR
jgi:hypothetical protein